ncbi:MAG: FAD/NAD(P)-binding protein [Ancrocorticia sp.]
MTEQHFDVVIVGGGPRAVALIERLTARLADQVSRGNESAEIPSLGSSGTTTSTGGAGIGSGSGVPEKPRVRVAVVDAVEVGPGATWRTDQTGQFLNNTPISETTIYPDESTPIDGPLPGGPTLVDWVRELAERGTHELPWVVEEARTLTPDSFSSRRLQGVYYAEQLARAEAAGFVSVERVIGVAQEIEYEVPGQDNDGATGPVCERLTNEAAGCEAVTHGGRTVRLADGRRLRGRTVVLAQGMVQAKPGPSVQSFIEGAERLGLLYIEPGMPSERPWHTIPAGEDCIVRGLGANFFDIAAELSAARGGRFEPVPGDELGRLRYIPSGKEPQLWAISRRGLPYRAKGLAGPEGKPRYGQAVFATPEWFDSLEYSQAPLFLGRDVWPRLAAEFGYAFAAVLAARDPEAIPAGIDALRNDLTKVLESFAAEYTEFAAAEGVEPAEGFAASGTFAVPEGFAASGRATPGSAEPAPLIGREPAAPEDTAQAVSKRAILPDNLATPEGAAQAINARIDAVLARHIDRPEGHPEAFRIDLLDRPTGGRAVNAEEWDRHVADLIEVELDAIANPLESPRQAVNLAMAATRGRVARLAALGLIEGRSVATELDGWFESDSLCLASGPPGVRVRQVIALIEAGLLHLVGPESQVIIDEDRGLFTAFSPITGVRVEARNFVEARMSKGKVKHTDDPLIGSLLASGRARIHRLPVNRLSTETVNSSAPTDIGSLVSVHAGSLAPRSTSSLAPEGFGLQTSIDVDTPGNTVATQSIEAIRPTSPDTPLALVAADGSADPHVLVLGIPANSTQPGSAIGAAPGIPSPLLAGADIAARSILADLAIP